MRTQEQLPECPVAVCVKLIGSKWKLLIMRNLLARPWRFNELLRSLEGVSRKVLTESLRSMENDGIVERIDLSQSIPHVEYRLTSLGESMRPILMSMQDWGEQYAAERLREEREHGSSGNDEAEAFDPQIQG
ncbi:MAG: helix-turn-helix domain-containing protein [Eubacteriales bacterium]|nr:helix-turn-helix domain-containing protein [Eubacteriales bacterium]